MPPKKLRPEQTLFFNEVFYRMRSGMQFYSNLRELMWACPTSSGPAISNRACAWVGNWSNMHGGHRHGHLVSIERTVVTGMRHGNHSNLHSNTCNLGSSQAMQSSAGGLTKHGRYIHTIPIVFFGNLCAAAALLVAYCAYPSIGRFHTKGSIVLLHSHCSN